MDTLGRLVKLCTEQKSAISFVVMTVMTAGGQQLFSLIAFQCPCTKHNHIYGFTFLFAPAVLLLIIGIYINNKTWTLFTGCCRNPTRMCPKRNPCQGLFVFGQLIMDSLVVPVTWISIALLHGSYYTCAMSAWPEYVRYLCKSESQECRTQFHKVTCDKADNETQEVLLELQAQSQVMGWCIITAMALLSLLCNCWSSCRSKASSVQMEFFRMYIIREKEKFHELAEEYATKLAETNVRSFFENRDPEYIELPSGTAWGKVSAMNTCHPTDRYYSALHRYVGHGESKTKLDFVDTHA